MSGLVYGSLFSGYEGLTMGAQAVLPGRTAWVSDIDKGSCKLLAHRFPDVPNLGDISAVDWSQVEPVDVLTGGFPCQDVSAAGKRAGIRPGTRSGLWAMFAYAISQLRPRLVVIENVRGLLSAKAHSDVEPCAWCVGDDPDGALRALGAVLGDLAGLGYDASWYGLRAADVGACHGRFRVFVVAYAAGDAGLRSITRPGVGHLPLSDGCGAGPDRLLPTPTSSDTNGSGAHGDGGLDLRTTVALLPTPDTGESLTGHGRRGVSGKRGHQSAANLDALATSGALLQTPSVADALGGHQTRGGARSDEPLLNGQAQAMHGNQWGDYAPAIARWEALTRPAPAPTMTSTKGNPQLAPTFVEWMMGLPAGWITDVPGLTRNEMLKLCGNGVVPQQAEAALRVLLAASEVAA